MIDETRPIFFQIAERIENDIIAGAIAEESQVPSTNEFAAFYRINPATAAKGVNLLVDDGIIYKKRGIGMFVSHGAKAQLVLKRRRQFFEQFIKPMMAEAQKLGIEAQDLAEMIRKGEDKS